MSVARSSLSAAVLLAFSVATAAAQQSHISYVSLNPCCIAQDGQGNSFIVSSSPLPPGPSVELVAMTTITVVKVDSSGNAISQFTFPAGKVKVYGRFLAGGEHKSVTELQTDITNGTLLSLSELATPVISGNYFAMAFGGGVDYPVRKKVSWRVGADYLTSTGTAQNHVRVVTGLVWRL